MRLAITRRARPLVLGAVAYDPKVVTIWEGFAEFFAGRGLPFSAVLYSTYEEQVDALLAGHVDVAWNSPLAWIQAQRLAAARGVTVAAVAMRDTDQDLRSVLAVRASGPVRALEDLRGRRVAVGALDSPQATLIPLEHLAAAGLAPGDDFEVVRHDVLVGKHGDHVGGEREAARALAAGQVDAVCLLDANLGLFGREGTLASQTVRVLAQTQPYDHCNFTVGPHAPAADVDRFVALLLDMTYFDPAVRPLMDMEGLKAWRPGRTTGYAALARAVDRFGVLSSWLPDDALR